MHFMREIRLRRVKYLRAWVDLFHFTWYGGIIFHNDRRSLFHIQRIFHFNFSNRCDIIVLKEGAFVSDRFHIVKKHIDKMDYFDLLASGAPLDEFDIESKEISARVKCEHTDQKWITKMIWSAFRFSYLHLRTVSLLFRKTKILPTKSRGSKDSFQ